MKQRISTRGVVNFDELPDSALARLEQLLSLSVVPFSPATVWRRVSAGTFPQPVRVSPQVTAWRVGEIRQWLKCPNDYLAKDETPSKKVLKGHLGEVL